MDWPGAMVKRLLMAMVAVGLFTGAADAAKKLPIPKPRLKPDNLVVSPPAEEETPVETSASPLAFPKAPLISGWSGKAIAEERMECARRIKGLKITYEAMAPFGRSGGCGAPAALKVESVAGVAIVPPAELSCDMVENLHGWVANAVAPAARKHLKKRLVKINNASAYACRRRNNSRSGKLSEHAKANALDIATLEFEDNSKISIKGDWSGLRQLVGTSGKGNFLREIRRYACIRFTTVLGPGSDPYHGDHFHVDVTRRKSGYRVCK
jgi:hypothetical protein